jgi:hypothetical protein
MFEFAIFCVIFLAVAYWLVLWVMGRREDVLHGEFVEGKLQAEEPVRAIFPEPSVRPVFPVSPVRSVLPRQPARPPAPEQPAFRPERLASLLNSIKRDLDRLAPK